MGRFARFTLATVFTASLSFASIAPAMADTSPNGETMLVSALVAAALTTQHEIVSVPPRIAALRQAHRLEEEQAAAAHTYVVSERHQDDVPFMAKTLPLLPLIMVLLTMTVAWMGSRRRFEPSHIAVQATDFDSRI